MKECKVKHLFVTGGYPSKDSRVKYRGIFGHRSVKAITSFCDSKVVRVSAYHPLRKSKDLYWYDGILVKKISTLIIPYFKGNYRFVEKTIPLCNYDLKEELEWADIIEVGGAYPIGILVLSLLRKNKIKKPLIADVVGSDAMIYLNKIFDKDPIWVKSYLSRFDHFICVSEFLSSLMQRFGVDTTKIDTVYKGIDLETFSIGEKNKKKDKGMTFLYLGGFDNKGFFSFSNLDMKGGKILLEAWSKFEKLKSEPKIILGGPNSNGSQVKKWRRMLQYPERVTILECIPPENVPAVYKMADCLVVPSLSEGLPNVIGEAMASGIPVLATDAGGIPEIVTNGQTGVLVKRGSVDDLVKGLIYCTENQEELNLISLRGHDFVKEKLTWQRYSESVKEIFYKKVLKIE